MSGHLGVGRGHSEETAEVVGKLVMWTAYVMVLVEWVCYIPLIQIKTRKAHELRVSCGPKWPMLAPFQSPRMRCGSVIPIIDNQGFEAMAKVHFEKVIFFLPLTKTLLAESCSRGKNV